MHETSGLAEQVIKITGESRLVVCADHWILVDGEADSWFFYCPKHDHSFIIGDTCKVEVLSPGRIVSLDQPTARWLIAWGEAEKMEMRNPDGTPVETKYGRADGDFAFHQFAEAANWPGREIHREITDWLYGL